MINISAGFTVPVDAETLAVPLTGVLTFNDLLGRALAGMGERAFFLYSPFAERGQEQDGGNCQLFIYGLLKFSSLLTASASHFLFQDVSKLVAELPWSAARAVTDIGAIADVAVQGRGRPRAKKVMK